MNNKTVKDIVKNYLKIWNYDGLYNEECGCDLKGLMSCASEEIPSCKPGYKTKGDDEHDFYINPNNTQGG